MSGERVDPARRLWRAWLSIYRGARTAAERLPTRWRMRRWSLPTIALSDFNVTEPPHFELIREHGGMPPLYGPSNHDDIGPMLAIVAARQPKLIVELGTGYGNGTANLAKTCPNARIVSVNAEAHDQGGYVTTFELSKQDIGKVYRQHGYGERVQQVFCDTLKADFGDFLQGLAADVAIIDACHDTPYVLNDFLKLTAFVRGGGIVLLHDTHPSLQGHLLGSYRACVELRRQGYDIRHLANTWWAVWIKP